MPEHDDQFREAVSDLANALQTAAAVTLEAAIDKAVRAVTRVQLRKGGV